MPKYIHLDRLTAIIGYAADLGGLRRLNGLVSEWDISGDCYNSYRTELVARPDRDKHSAHHPSVTQRLDILTRCRRCERCLRARYRRWLGAAFGEIRASSRTWAGTLTLSPDNHFLALSKARARLAAQGVDFDTLDPASQFLERHRAISPALTKYIKRVRHASGAKLRYLLITEAHQTGLPHYHMLVHEQPLGGTVPHRILSQQWRGGFERWRLSDPQEPRAAAYLCKYVSKSLLARVRASQGYGVTTSELHTHVIGELRKVLREIPRSEGMSKEQSDLEGSPSEGVGPIFSSLSFWEG